MRAIILAAGRGSRMGHLTDHTPKALLRVNHKYLIEYSIENLKMAGIKEIIINVSYGGEQIKTALGNGSHWGINISYSEEPNALETGGGIFKALPLLGKEPFIATSCDIISDYVFEHLSIDPQKLAHLVLVKNPDFHPAGDFCLDNCKIYLGNKQTYTYANISILHPDLFKNCRPGKFLLGPLLKEAIRENKVSGELFLGRWYNVGTPKDLAEMNASRSAGAYEDNSYRGA